MARTFFFLLFFFALSAPIAADQEISAAKIVAQADEIRFPQRSFEVHVAITSSMGGTRETDVKEYDILSRGIDRTLVRTTAPPMDRGQVLLMRGRDLWAFLPTLSQPVRLALSQRLTGQVANGDLARANFSGDYTPTVTGTETIKGQQYYVLDLKAVDRGVTYHRVIYRVNKTNFRPLNAEFYAVSGKLLKTCSYENFKETGGAIRPTTLVMEDALNQGTKSVLEYRNFQVHDIPEKYFNKDYLPKLQ
ncbi:MAG TPA: outer membrane lipoprotein-sorting protein [Candidatus Binatia bacterium]